MADGQEKGEEEASLVNNNKKAKQLKNKKKKQATKKNKQEQNDKSQGLPQTSDRLDSEEGEIHETKTPQESFDEELAWCINQLEIGLTTQKPDKNTAQKTEKIINKLKSPKTCLPKKRQIMFSVFGDYRRKIAEYKKKNPKKESERPIKVFAVEKKQQRSVFFRVSKARREYVNESLPNSTQEEVPQKQVSLGSIESRSWTFQPSSANDFKFNFYDLEEIK